MTKTQRVIIVNPESGFYGRCGRLERRMGSTLLISLEGLPGIPWTYHLTLPFGESEVSIAPPARRRHR